MCIKNYDKNEFTKKLEELDYNLEKLRIMPYSEIAWIKLNDLMIKVKNFIFYFNIYNSSKDIEEHLDKLDLIFQSEDRPLSRNIITTYKKLIEQILGLYSNYKDERLRTFFKSSLKVISFSVFVILGILAIKSNFPLLYSFIGFGIIFILMCITVWGSFITYSKLMFKELWNNKRELMVIVVALIIVVITFNFSYKIQLHQNVTQTRLTLTELNLSELNDTFLYEYVGNSSKLFVSSRVEEINNIPAFKLANFFINFMPYVILFLVVLMIVIRLLSFDRRDCLANSKLENIKKILLK